MSRQDSAHVTFRNGMHARFKPRPYIPTPTQVDALIRFNRYVVDVER